MMPKGQKLLNILFLIGTCHSNPANVHSSGHSFSIEDLKEYTNGKKISGILEKFNIPRRNSTYAYVLKLSDVFAQ